MSMATLIIDTVIAALETAEIPVVGGYPGEMLPELSQPMAAVNLKNLDYTARCATVLVTVLVPMGFGGGACEEEAIRVGKILEALGGACVQEACRFNGYGDAYSVDVMGTFYGEAVLAEWETESDFTVKIGQTEITNAVGFRAEQVVDPSTGTPANDAAWTFRLEERFRRGDHPKPSPVEPFTLTVRRSGSTELYTECKWTSVQLENTTTGLRQIRQGVAKTRAFAVVD